MLQELDLSKSSFCQDLLAKDVCHLLDGDPFPSLTVRGSTATLSTLQWLLVPANIPHNAICALSKLFRHRVPLVDNKILVEDFKDLAAAHVGHRTRDPLV